MRKESLVIVPMAPIFVNVPIKFQLKNSKLNHGQFMIILLKNK
jgi:hypothetical protein